MHITQFSSRNIYLLGFSFYKFYKALDFYHIQQLLQRFHTQAQQLTSRQNSSKFQEKSVLMADLTSEVDQVHHIQSSAVSQTVLQLQSQISQTVGTKFMLMAFQATAQAISFHHQAQVAHQAVQHQVHHQEQSSDKATQDSTPTSDNGVALS